MPDMTQLYRDPLDPTGVSLVPGQGRREIASVGDLPEHAVELHAFPSHDQAIAFTAGISLVAGHSLSAANAIAWSRAAGERMGNVVVVALLDEPRRPGTSLEEAIRVVGYRASGEEGKIVARHLEERSRRDEAERRARSATVAPALSALRDVGLKASYDTNTGCIIRCGTGVGGYSGEIWTSVSPTDDGLWQVSCEMQQIADECAGEAPDARVIAAITAAGASHDPREQKFSFPPVVPDLLGADIRQTAALCETLLSIALDIWRENAAAATAASDARKRLNSARRRQAVKEGPLSYDERDSLERGLVRYRDITCRGEGWGAFNGLFVSNMQGSHLHDAWHKADNRGDAEAARLCGMLLRLDQHSRGKVFERVRGMHWRGDEQVESGPSPR